MTSTRRAVWFSAAIVVCAGAALMARAALLSVRVVDVSASSLWRFLVDPEVRNIPQLAGASLVRFQSQPQEGTSSARDGVAFVPVDPQVAVDGATAYFKALGYSLNSAAAGACDTAHAPHGCTLTLTRDRAEVSIQQRRGVLEITKLNTD